MNWLFTFIFIISLYIQSQLFGSMLVKCTNYENTREKRLILGYYFLFFLGFLAYFPSILFKYGWNIYFIFFSILIGVMDIVSIFFIRDEFKTMFSQFSLVNLLKENWLIYVFVIFMVVIAMSNNLSYLHLNYDDTFYIGKMVNSIETPQFFNEDYFNGSLLQTNIYGLDRLLNSYEIVCAYLAYLFKIRVPFFARVSMNIVNYFMVGITFKELTAHMIKRKYAQYSILALCTFILPYGFIQAALKWFCIRSYDLWQFQTAMFYGGSMVRVLSLPTLFIFSYPLIKKLNIKQILIVGILSVTYLSFSSIIIPNFIFFVVTILFVKFIYNIVESFKEKKWILLGANVIGIGIEAALLYFSNCLTSIQLSFLNTSSYTEELNTLVNYYNDTLSADFILRFGFIPLIAAFVILKGKKKLYVVFSAILYGLIYSQYFNTLLLYSSFNYFFVAARTCASVQHCIFILYGIIFAYIFEKLDNVTIPSFLSIGYVLLMCGIFFVGRSYFLQFDFLGSGIHSDGWTFQRILDINTNMIPETATEIGDYFNTLKYGNYTLYSQEEIKNPNVSFESGNFVLASNRIVIVNGDSILDSFCETGSGDIDQVLDILKSKNIDYILVDAKINHSGLDQVSIVNNHYLYKVKKS